MRYLLTIALGSLALLPVAQSQRMGMAGHSSGGFSRGSSGFSRGSGFSAHSRVSSGFRGGFATSRVRTGANFGATRRTFAGGRSFGSRRFRDFDRDDFRFGRFGRFRDRDDFFRFRRFPRPFIFAGGCIHGGFFGGFPCRNFLFGDSFVWGYAPYYADYSDYPSASPPPPPEPAPVDSNNSSQLAYEVGRLSGEVEQLRDEEGRRDDRHATISESDLSAPAPEPGPGREPETPVTLVFRNGTRLSVQNYALVGNTVWILSNRAARKIPLTDLDIPATEKVNSDNGVEFHLAEASANR